jgi:hypothetical protein
MANFTQARCDASRITREKRSIDGTFSDWVIRITDENGNYYEYVDSSAPSNRALDTHKTEIDTHLKTIEFRAAPTNIQTVEAAEVL